MPCVAGGSAGEHSSERGVYRCIACDYEWVMIPLPYQVWCKKCGKQML